MRNDDVVFLAHVKYDDYARRRAKSIYGQVEATMPASGTKNAYAFLKVAPWFRGPATLKVAGVQFNKGRTFLALQILGASQPQGNVVIRDRENPGGEGLDDSDQSGTSAGGLKTTNLRNLPEIIDLTSDDEPDHGSVPIEIIEDVFEVLGTPRTVIDRRRDAGNRGTQRSPGSEDIRTVSPGEPHGSGKGVGYGANHAPIKLESHGVLRDMWDAARQLKNEYPDLVRSVEWFTFKDGFSSELEPKLIALRPFAKEDKRISSDVKGWVYHDHDTKTPRGVLVMRLQIGVRTVYLIEIQRRIVQRKHGKGALKHIEENFRGLVFELREPGGFRPWLGEYMNLVRTTKGVVTRLVNRCPGKAHTFNHVPGEHEKALGETAIKNALNKLDVRLSKASLSRRSEA
jgi:hypothetical protein